MKHGEHTIESGLLALNERVAFHRAQAEKFEKLALAFCEAEAVLRTLNGDAPSPKVGRPLNGNVRDAFQDAINKMGDTFTLTDLKKVTKGIRLDVFRRLFREARKDGSVIEKVKAMGRREGIYSKPGRTTNIVETKPAT